MPSKPEEVGDERAQLEETLRDVVVPGIDSTAVHDGDEASGSLAGSYPNPSLRVTGVKPGTYHRATVTVGADGRVLALSENAEPLPSEGWPHRTVHGDAKIDPDDCFLFVDASSAPVRVELPLVSDIADSAVTRRFVIKKIDRSPNPILIKTTGKDNINRAVTGVKLTLQRHTCSLVADGQGWFMVSTDAPALADSSNSVVLAVRKRGERSIPAGRGIAVVGFDEEVDRILVDVATANPKLPQISALGVSATEILPDRDGTMVVAGIVGGIDTSAYEVGQSLYLSPKEPGVLVSRRPSGDATYQVQQLARVVRVDVEGGMVQVVGAGEFVPLPLLRNDHVWVGDRSSMPQQMPTSTLPHPRHRDMHVQGAHDAIEGDRLAVHFVPDQYQRNVSGDEVTNEWQLGAHLKGIDQALKALWAALDQLN